MLETIHFFHISQSIQEWWNTAEKKLNDLFNYLFQIALM